MINPIISIITVCNNSCGKTDDFILSIINQSFKDFEIICVNSDSEYDINNFLSELSKQDERVKIIDLPDNSDVNIAKRAGLNVASGRYICFFTEMNPLPEGFLQEIFMDVISNENTSIPFPDSKIFKRELVESFPNFEEMIKLNINEQFQMIKDNLESKDVIRQQELDDLNKNIDNKINNKAYEATLRCNLLEKLIYDKQCEIDEKFKTSLENTYNHQQENINKVYEYINSETGKKGLEISKVYSEITNNYKYTEKLVEESKQTFYSELDQIHKRIDELRQEQENRYNSLQRLIETITEDFKNKLNAIDTISKTNLSEVSDKIVTVWDLEKNMNQNIDRIYSCMNENNSKFYEELSKLYKELNEKINRN